MSHPAAEDTFYTGSERVVLERYLDVHRDAVVDRLSGVSEVDARRRLVPSLTTLGGVVKHLRWVEFGWFHQVLGARTGDNRRDHERDWEFTVGPEDTVESLLDDYRAVCAGSRATVARHELDEEVPHYSRGAVSVRWLLAHLVEETARHAGHMDILREQIDALVS
ncbi:DinB family protein [Actinophytocola xanthii]|uniref:Mini-circle protein n=1 Tax=Actinophytocola xanthii TaxID=1912961 RepID=A0A1Q8CT16_9PSEU|nr:DinB family protein [Actinophytocola xanthii]OLF17477.1 hypothetical protein BU204_11075 [Actinophytocola xanthii]